MKNKITKSISGMTVGILLMYIFGQITFWVENRKFWAGYNQQ